MGKIIAKVFTIHLQGLPDGAHLYYKFIDDNGNRIVQVNGLDFDKKTGEVVPAGMPDNINDSIRLFLDTAGYFKGNPLATKSLNWII